MKLTLQKNELKNALAGLGKIIASRTTVPVLGHIRFSSEGRVVTVEGTNLEESARYTFGETTADGAGTFLVPFAELRDAVKTAGPAPVVLESHGGEAVTVSVPIQDTMIARRLATVPADEWPELPRVGACKPLPGFLSTYRRLLPFASDDQTRLTINGVCLDVSEKGEKAGCLVATDGRRLTSINSTDIPLTESVIVPRSKFLTWPALGDDAAVGLNTKKDAPTWLGLTTGPWTWNVKAVDGSYPNWRQVVPDLTQYAHAVTLGSDGVKFTRQVLDTLPGKEALVLRVGRDGFWIGGMAAGDKDRTWVKIEDCRHSQANGRIAVNRRFVAQMLDAGFTQLSFLDELSPLHATDGDGGIHVLMPMRVDDEVEPKPDPGTPVPGESGDNPDPGTDSEPDPAQQLEEAGAAGQPGPEQPTESTPKRKEKTAMAKHEQPQPEAGSLDQVEAACERVRALLRDTAGAVTELTNALKQVAKAEKTRDKELSGARDALKKLQAISI